MDWLKILGIPGGILGAILAYFRIRKLRKDNIESKKGELNANPTHSISPEQIIDELKNNGNKVKYEGYKIKWHAVFDKFETSMIGGGQLFLKIDNVVLRTKASLNDYPQLKNEEKDKKYIATGIIKKAENQTIHLELIDLKLDPFFVI